MTDDGFFLVSASKDGKPMLRNGDTGDWVGTFEGHKGAVWGASINKDATYVGTAAADFTARVWDTLTGDEIQAFQHSHIVRTCQFSGDQKRLATGGKEKKVRIFDLTQPDAEPRVFEGSPSGVRALAWHADDASLLSSMSDHGGFWVWDVRTGEVVQKFETDKPVTSMEIAEDDATVVTADGCNVRFWDMRTRKMIKVHSEPFLVESASYCKEKGYFAAGGEDMWVRLFDFETCKELDCNKGHHGPVHNVRFAPGGETYSSGSEDGTIRIWRSDFHLQGAEAAAA